MKKEIASKNGNKKRVSVILTEQDYAKLFCLAQKTSRTIPGYLRWLLHQHFRKPEEKSKLEGE